MDVIVQSDRNPMTIAHVLPEGNGTLDRQVHRFEPGTSFWVDLTDEANADRKRHRPIPILHELFECGFDASQGGRLCLAINLGTPRGNDISCLSHSSG